MANDWYYTLNGQQQPAPTSSEELRKLASGGQLQQTDMVWKEGMANWAPASSIKGLFNRSDSSPSTIDSRPPADTRPAGRSRREKASEPAKKDGPPDRGGLLALHPLLVLLISICTGGLFGLIYAYVVCSAYAAQQKRTSDSTGRPLGTVRHPLAVLLLSSLTLGLYFAWWTYRVMRECAAYTGRADLDAKTELALMLLFPPYAGYVAIFRLPDWIRQVQTTAGQSPSGMLDKTGAFLNPCLFFALPMLGMLYQDALNQVWLTAS